MILAAVPAQVRPAMQTEHMTVQVKARVSPPPHSYVSLLDGIFGDATRRSARGQNGADNHRRPPSETRYADRAHDSSSQGTRQPTPTQLRLAPRRIFGDATRRSARGTASEAIVDKCFCCMETTMWGVQVSSFAADS
jgi:hypothetical protein